MAGLSDSAAVIALRITSNSSDAQADFEKFKKELNAVEKEAKAAGTPLEQLGATAGLSAQQFDTLKVGALAAVAGIGAMVATATAAAVGIFNLTKSASDFGSALFDAQAKTGLSAETLSTLKINAEKAGSSFEQISSSVTKFSILLGESVSGNEKATATLEKYGVTSRETNEALDQAITSIASLTSEEERSAAAKALFKDRAADIIPVIEQMNGSLSDATKEANRLGQTMSQAAIEAADDFGDALTDLQSQASAVGREFATQLMPSITSAMKSISDFMADNQGIAAEWGQALRDECSKVVDGLTLLGQAASLNFKILTLGMVSTQGESIVWSGILKGSIEALLGPLYQVIKYAGAAKQALDYLLGNNSVAGKTGGDAGIPLPDYKGQFSPDAMKKRDAWDYDQEQKKGEDAKQAAGERAKAREAAQKQEQAALAKHLQLLLSTERQGFQTLYAEVEKAYLDQRTLVDEKGQEYVLTDKQYREQALNNIRVYGIKAQELLDKQKAQDLKGKTGVDRENVILQANQAGQALYNELARAREDVEKTVTGVVKKELGKRDATVKKSLADQQALERSYAETRMQQFENDLQIKAITEKQFIQKTAQEKLALLQSELKAETDTNKQALIRQEIERTNLKLTRDLVAVEQKNREETRKFWADEVKAAGERLKAFEDQMATDEEAAGRKRAEKAAAKQQDILNRTVGSGQAISAMGQLFDHFSSTGNSTAIAGIEAMADAFSGLGQAIGQVVSAWVLYGSAGQSVRQVTAQILAGIAQQAAVKAVFELAEGFAALAMAFFGIPNAGPSAAAHFTAAATYGTIAGIAAIAGRATAGDSFKKQTATTGNRSAAPATTKNAQGGGQVYSSNPNAIVENGGNKPAISNPFKSEIVLKIVSTKDHIINTVRENVANNGTLRTVIQEA